jgi:hypothetical protein
MKSFRGQLKNELLFDPKIEEPHVLANIYKGTGLLKGRWHRI